ncbi:MAG TPA: HAD-IA family hydrolase [Gaiellaceae bacterium]|jgi:2-haloacid dehalogenase
MAGERWATFDCYGTLIDWNGGIGRELDRLFGAERHDELLAHYHELEREVEHEDPELPYRAVMSTVLERMGAPGEEHDALGRSLPRWEPFPEVPAALDDARGRGWKLVILSNTDREFIEASMARIGVPFELAIVAGEIGSYKPGHRHWQAFTERTGADPRRHVHVAASLFHDIAPARELGLPTVWINRLGERPDPEPTRELPDLARLAETLDEILPA